MATIVIQRNGVTTESVKVSSEVYEMFWTGKRNPQHEEIYKKEVEFDEDGSFILINSIKEI